MLIVQIVVYCTVGWKAPSTTIRKWTTSKVFIQGKDKCFYAGADFIWHS